MTRLGLSLKPPSLPLSPRLGCVEAAFPASVGAALKGHPSLRCCGEAEGHMSGEATFPAFVAQVTVVREATFPAFPAAARKALPSPALLGRRLWHTRREAPSSPFGGLSKLDSDGASLAFTAREVLSPSRILLGVRDASIGRRERSCLRGECAWSDEGREYGFLSAIA